MGEAPVLRIHRSLFKAMDLYNEDRLGWMEKAMSLAPIVRMLLGPLTVVVISDADAARSLLISDSGRWRRAPVSTITARLAIGENLFTQGNRSWAKLQPAVAPDFRKRALDARLVDLESLVEEEIEAIPLDTPVVLDQAMGRIAMIVASWVLFAQRLSRERADELAAHQRVIVDWMGQRIGSPWSVVPVAPWSGRIMRKHRVVLETYADEVVSSGRNSDNPQRDVLQALLEARPGGRALSQRQLRYQVLGLFGAGNETTAATMGWAMVHGAAHPEKWAALRNDPSTVGPYIDETLRLRPQAWGISRSTRLSTEDVVVADRRYRVLPHHGVIINVWGINHDPKLWPHPERFEPSRQLDLTKAQERASFPFGLGPRGCIGQQLAMTEMLAVLPALARRGEVRLERQPIPDPVLTLRAAGGLRGTFTAPLVIQPNVGLPSGK